MGTASENEGTPAAERAAVNTRWQMIFGLILLAAVVLAVIVLITVGLNDAKSGTSGAAQNTPVQDTAAITSAEPDTSALPSVETETPVPDEPSPSPTAAVSSITLKYLGSERTEFTEAVGEVVPLTAEVYPTDVTEPVVWASSNESVARVNDSGEVTGVASGSTEITATCGGVTATCKVVVR